MYIANIFIFILIGILATQTQATTFNIAKWGIIDITNIIIPQGTTEVNARKNYIESVPASYFTDLPNINKIQLQENRIIDIQNNSFSQIPNLRILWLGHNYLSTLTKGMFTGLIQLEWLAVNDNRIQNIPSQVFWDLKSLQKLELDTNDLKSLDIASAFDPMNHPSDLKLWLFKNLWVCDMEMCAFVTARGSWYSVKDKTGPEEQAQCRFPCALGGRRLINLMAEELRCTLNQCLYIKALHYVLDGKGYLSSRWFRTLQKSSLSETTQQDDIRIMTSLC